MTTETKQDTSGKIGRFEYQKMVEGKEGAIYLFKDLEQFNEIQNEIFVSHEPDVAYLDKGLSPAQQILHTKG